jgi:MFS family permease
MTEWWSTQMAGVIGGVGGGGLGALGGLLGALAGWLAPQGRGKAFILGGFVAMIVIGVASLCVGIVAITLGQPYHVWYPLCLVGFILSLVPGILLPVIRMRYRQAEARRMEAEQLRRA